MYLPVYIPVIGFVEQGCKGCPYMFFWLMALSICTDAWKSHKQIVVIVKHRRKDVLILFWLSFATEWFCCLAAPTNSTAASQTQRHATTISSRQDSILTDTLRKICWTGILLDPFYKSRHAVPNRVNFHQFCLVWCSATLIKPTWNLIQLSRTISQRLLDWVDTVRLMKPNFSCGSARLKKTGLTVLRK